MVNIFGNKYSYQILYSIHTEKITKSNFLLARDNRLFEQLFIVHSQPLHGFRRCCDWENSHRLSEKLVSLSMMGTQLKASLKPHSTIVLIVMVGWDSGGLHLGLPRCHETPILSDSCTADSFFFHSGVVGVVRCGVEFFTRRNN